MKDKKDIEQLMDNVDTKTIEDIKDEMAVNYGYKNYEEISISYRDGSLNQINYDLFFDDVIECYASYREFFSVKKTLMFCARKVLPLSASLSSEFLSKSTEKQILININN